MHGTRFSRWITDHLVHAEMRGNPVTSSRGVVISSLWHTLSSDDCDVDMRSTPIPLLKLFGRAFLISEFNVYEAHKDVSVEIVFDEYNHLRLTPKSNSQNGRFLAPFPFTQRVVLLKGEKWVYYVEEDINSLPRHLPLLEVGRSVSMTKDAFERGPVALADRGRRCFVKAHGR